jgi:hypothetical protein
MHSSKIPANLNKSLVDLRNISLMKIITINPKILVVNYIKQNTYFSKIIGYNNIK